MGLLWFSINVYLKGIWPWPVCPSWLEYRPVHWKAGGLILSQGTQPGCRFDPQSEHI